MARVRGGRLSMIYQDPMSSLNPLQPVGRAGRRGDRGARERRRARGARPQRRVARDVGLPQPERRFDDYPHQFSGGMRQRVMIAMAIATNPDVLIADEPTTALDVTTQARIMELLDRIVEERGMGVILITHDLGLASSFCEDMHVMYGGRIVESGAAAAVLRTPVHPYSEALLESICTPRPRRRPADRGDLGPAAVARPAPDRLPVPPALRLRAGRLRRRPLRRRSRSTTDDGMPLPAREGAPVTVHDRPAAAEDRDRDPLVVVENLSRHFRLGGRTSGASSSAVDDVSLVLPRGETLGLVGESGSGKSTLARLLLRLDRPTSGKVHFDAKDVFAVSSRELRRLRREMQIVFQDPYASLNKRKTVEQIVSFPLLVHERSSAASSARPAWRSCSSSSAFGLLMPPPTRASSPAASASGSASLARWRSIRALSCSTRPSPPWTSRSRRRS